MEAAFWRNLGQTLVEDGKIAEAVPPLERAVALQPTGAAERFWLARACLLADKPLDAQAQIGVLRAGPGRGGGTVRRVGLTGKSPRVILGHTMTSRKARVVVDTCRGEVMTQTRRIVQIRVSSDDMPRGSGPWAGVGAR